MLRESFSTNSTKSRSIDINKIEFEKSGKFGDFETSIKSRSQKVEYNDAKSYARKGQNLSRKSRSNSICEQSEDEQGLQLPRTQRLLRMALNFPQVLKLFSNISRKRRLNALTGKFFIWYSAYISWKHEQEIALRNKSTKSTIIQCLVRAKLARNRIKLIRKHIEEKAAKKNLCACLLIQSVVRMFIAKNRLSKRRHFYSIAHRLRSIIRLQRIFRGFLGRAKAILHERVALLHFLRNWSHGRTSKLYTMRGLESPAIQAAIYTAIVLCTVPSKPMRNLPPLSIMKKYRAGLHAVYWELQHYYEGRKKEKADRRRERRDMFSEDLHSMVVEQIARAHIAKEKRLAEELRVYRMREYLEELRREKYKEGQSLLNLENKFGIERREQKEKLWRETARQIATEEAIAKCVMRELEREWEMMNFEDERSRVQELSRVKALDESAALQAEKEKVLAIKVDAFQQNKYIYSNRLKCGISEVQLLTSMAAYEHHLKLICCSYFKSLPLNPLTKSHCCRAISPPLTTIKIALFQQRFHRHLLHKLLVDCGFSYRLLILEQARMKRQIRLGNVERKYFIEYLHTCIEYADHPIHNILQDKINLFDDLQGYVIHKPSIQVIQGSGDNNSRAMEVDQLTFSFQTSFTRISQLATIIRYKDIKHKVRQAFRELSMALTTFKLEHQRLTKLRKEIKGNKLLRSDRLKAFSAAAAIEKNLFYLRPEIIRLSQILYDITFYEVRLFLDLFFSSDFDAASASRTRSAPAAAAVASAMSLKAMSSDDVEPLQKFEIKLKIAAEKERERSNQAELEQSAAKLLKATIKRPSKDSNFGAVKRQSRLFAPTKSSLSKKLPKPKETTRKQSVKKLPSMLKRRRSFGSLQDVYDSVGELGAQQGKGKSKGRSADEDVPLPELRSFDATSEETDGYWQDILANINYYVIDPLELSTIEAPPKPSYQDDGYRHVVKELPKTAEAKPNNSATSTKPFHFPTARTSRLRYKKIDMSGSKAKEQKFFDIPGGNAFLDANLFRYDFYAWGTRMKAWVKSVIDWKEAHAKQWKEKHQMKCVYNLQRVHYLCDVLASTDGFQHQSTRSETEALDFLRRIQAAEEEDLLELKVCQCDIKVACLLHKKEFLTQLTSEELDRSLGRQSLSLVARFSMLHSLEVAPARYFTAMANIPLPTVAEHCNSLIHSAIVSPATELVLLEKEHLETADLAQTLLRNNIICLDPLNGKLSARVQSMAHIGVQSFSTTEDWTLRFPMYLHPVLHYGKRSPAEAFHKQLAKEKKSGIVGKYSLIDRLDHRADECARLLLRHLKKRSLLRRTLSACMATEKEIIALEASAMGKEDALVHIMRSRENERRWLATHRHWYTPILQLFCPNHGKRIFPEDASLYRLAEQASRGSPKILLYRENVDQLMKRLINSDYEVLDKETARLYNSRDECRALNWTRVGHALREIDEQVTENNYFRRISWVTGQAVFLSSSAGAERGERGDGGHFDPKQLILSNIAEMAKVYEATAKLSESGTSTNARSADFAEVWIAGSARHLIFVSRVVENEQLNNRGLLLLEVLKDSLASIRIDEAMQFHNALSESHKLENVIHLRRCAYSERKLCDCCNRRPADVISSRRRFLCSDHLFNECPRDYLSSVASLQHGLIATVLKERYLVDKQVNNALIKLQSLIRRKIAIKRCRLLIKSPL